MSLYYLLMDDTQVFITMILKTLRIHNFVSSELHCKSMAKFI